MKRQLGRGELTFYVSRFNDHIFSICQYSSSSGVGRPKIVVMIRTMPLSAMTSSTRASTRAEPTSSETSPLTLLALTGLGVFGWALAWWGFYTTGFAVAADPNDADTAWYVPAIKDERRVPVNGELAVTRTRDGGRTAARGGPRGRACRCRETWERW